MSERGAKKKIIQFVRREYSQKHPLSIQVARTKPEIIFSKGFLSSLRIQRQKISSLIVLVEYLEEYRIYSFTKTAKLLGAENIAKTEKFQKLVNKSTSKIYELPKPQKH